MEIFGEWNFSRKVLNREHFKPTVIKQDCAKFLSVKSMLIKREDCLETAGVYQVCYQYQSPVNRHQNGDAVK